MNYDKKVFFIVFSMLFLTGKIFTQVVYGDLQVFEQIDDGIGVQILLDRLNSANDDSKL